MNLLKDTARIFQQNGPSSLRDQEHVDNILADNGLNELIGLPIHIFYSDLFCSCFGIDDEKGRAFVIKLSPHDGIFSDEQKLRGIFPMAAGRHVASGEVVDGYSYTISVFPSGFGLERASPESKDYLAVPTAGLLSIIHTSEVIGLQNSEDSYGDFFDLSEAIKKVPKYYSREFFKEFPYLSENLLSDFSNLLKEDFFSNVLHNSPAPLKEGICVGPIKSRDIFIMNAELPAPAFLFWPSAHIGDPSIDLLTFIRSSQLDKKLFLESYCATRGLDKSIKLKLDVFARSLWQYDLYLGFIDELFKNIFGFDSHQSSSILNARRFSDNRQAMANRDEFKAFLEPMDHFFVDKIKG